MYHNAVKQKNQKIDLEMVKNYLVLPVGGSKFKQIKHTLEHTLLKNKKNILLKKRDALFPYILYIMWYTM